MYGRFLIGTSYIWQSSRSNRFLNGENHFFGSVVFHGRPTVDALLVVRVDDIDQVETLRILIFLFDV